MENTNISICLIGTVSVGKSVLLNSFFCKDLTQYKIKRTTMVPCLYIEDEKINSSEFVSTEIKDHISKVNKSIIEKTEKGNQLTIDECNELVFHVPKLDIKICEEGNMNIYDIPGLNDARTKEIYYEYLRLNFHKFNVVVFMVDIHSGLNTSDEMDILKFIIEQIKIQKEKNIGLLVVVNKADFMCLTTGEDGNESLNIQEEELKEMFDQVKDTVSNEFLKDNLTDRIIDIIPLSALDSFLYRVIKKEGDKYQLRSEDMLKIGINQMGKQFSKKTPEQQKIIVTEIIQDSEFVNDMIKLSGFSFLEKSLYQFFELDENSKKIRIENLIYQLKRCLSIRDIILQNYSGKDKFKEIPFIQNELSKIHSILKSIQKINHHDYLIYFDLMLKDIHFCYDKILQTFKNNNFNDIFTICSIHLTIQNIFKLSFSDFYSEKMDMIFIKKIITIMKNSVKKSFPIQRFHLIRNVLSEIFSDCDASDFIWSELIDEILKNTNGLQTILFDEHYLYHIKDFVETFIHISSSKIIEFSKIYELLRFIVLNHIFKIQHLTQEQLATEDFYEKKMIQKWIYEKSGELVMSNFIEEIRRPLQIVDDSIVLHKLLQFSLKGWKNDYLKQEVYLIDVLYLYITFKNNPESIKFEDKLFYNIIDSFMTSSFIDL